MGEMTASQPKASEGVVTDRRPNGRFQKGHSLGGPGNTSKRINVPALAKRKAAELGLDIDELVWDVVLAMVLKGSCGDVAAARLVHDMLGEQEPKGPLVAIGVNGGGNVPQAPPLTSGPNGAPPLDQHLKLLVGIARDRGLADLASMADAHPADVVSVIATRSAEEDLLS